MQSTLSLSTRPLVPRSWMPTGDDLVRVVEAGGRDALAKSGVDVLVRLNAEDTRHHGLAVLGPALARSLPLVLLPPLGRRAGRAFPG